MDMHHAAHPSNVHAPPDSRTAYREVADVAEMCAAGLALQADPPRKPMSATAARVLCIDALRCPTGDAWRSLATIHRPAAFGGLSGCWVQNCYGTMAEACERAKRISNVNGGAAIGIVREVTSSVPILEGERSFAPFAVVDRDTRIVQDLPQALQLHQDMVDRRHAATATGSYPQAQRDRDEEAEREVLVAALGFAPEDRSSLGTRYAATSGEMLRWVREAVSQAQNPASA